MLALAIISTILLGLLLLTFIIVGADSLDEMKKIENIVLIIIELTIVFAIVVTWILYAK